MEERIDKLEKMAKVNCIIMSTVLCLILLLFGTLIFGTVKISSLAGDFAPAIKAVSRLDMNTVEEGLKAAKKLSDSNITEMAGSLDELVELKDELPKLFEMSESLQSLEEFKDALPTLELLADTVKTINDKVDKISKFFSR